MALRLDRSRSKERARRYVVPRSSLAPASAVVPVLKVVRSRVPTAVITPMMTAKMEAAMDQ